MATTAPSVSFAVTFSLRIKIETGMITMGDMDVREETVPVAVCCNASNERLTPMKGPKTEPNAMCPSAPLSFRAALISGHFFRIVIITVNPIKAAIKRIGSSEGAIGSHT